MKQLLLDTHYIIPTGNKQCPVVVRPTIACRLLNSAFAVVLAFMAFMRLCNDDLEHNGRFYIGLGILVLGVALFVRNAVRGEHPEKSLDTDEYTNLQQYALYIWKTRLQNIFLSLVYVCLYFSDTCPPLFYVGLVFFAFFSLVKWYFSQQIKQASRLTSDLLLAPRVEVTLGVSGLARKLELAMLASMVIAIGVALRIGLPSYLSGMNAPMWVLSACLVLCSLGVTFSLRKMMRQPISVADQAEANEVMRDRWMVPLIGLCLNFLATAALVLAYLFG